MTTADGLSKNLTREEFERFRDLIHRQSGIYLEEPKLDSLRISLVTRATRLGQDTLDAYYRELERDEGEFNELMNLVTVNETSFFRFPAQFDVLRHSVLPDIMSRKSDEDRSLCVWSAGCSTGEEPYSIAMTLLDSGIEGLRWDLRVLGTDVSTDALDRARAGEYQRRTLLNAPPDVLLRHFEQVGEGESYRVNERVRSHVGFEHQNLVREPYPLGRRGTWDVIFCRNVTIYFRAESTRRVVANFWDSLSPGGYLFVGHSETLSGISDAFEPVESGGIFLYRKPATRRTLWSGRHAEETCEIPGTGRSETDVRPESPVGPTSLCRDAFATPQAPPTKSAPHGVESGPEGADAYVLSAYLHADAGDYEDAIRASQRALSIDPLLSSARYVLGIIYQRQGDSLRAVSELRKTLYIDAHFALAHLSLGNIYRSEQKWDASAREYENAIEALRKHPNGDWTRYSGGFTADLLLRACERSLVECREAMGAT